MALRSKPQPVDERAIEALINKGGTVAAPEARARQQKTAKPSSRALQLTQLRLPPDLVERIDRVKEKRQVPPSRHTWILEAIMAKLAAEE